MTPAAVARTALRALASNPLRSLLTALGVIIGVAAVITTISIGNGARASARAQLTALGTNLLFVFPSRAAGPGGVVQGQTVQTLTAADAQAIQQLPGVQAVSPELTRSATVVAGEHNDVVPVEGVTPAFTTVHDWPTVEGTFFTTEDLRGNARVALIGQTVRATFFPGTSPVGQRLRINGMLFTVIGVMDAKGATGFNDRDDVVLIPLTSMQNRLFGAAFIGLAVVKVRDGAEPQTVMADVQSLLARRHRLGPGQPTDFQIRNQADVVQAFQGVLRTITAMLGAVAGVSLLVGGIGIMNIMLVSVTERIREIGIRKAVGATRRDVLVQFLAEAVALSLAGGVLGILLALALSRLISALAGWAMLISAWALVLAVAFASAVGVFFGLYPARQAAGLDPIAALRHE